MKVTVLGAAGGIGQSLSLLLKRELPRGAELSLYDIDPVTPGLAVDLSHIPTPVKMSGYTGSDPTPALQNADIVVIAAGKARKPGMTRADLFNVNASIVRDLTEKIADVCPNACIGVITNPVNTLVPIAAKVLERKGVYNKNKLFGVTTLDVIRARTFVAEVTGKDITNVVVPVIGGHSGTTILPLLSQALVEDKNVFFTHEEIVKLTHRIQNAGTEVVEAKAGSGSATLSMAAAGARFTHSLVRGFLGEEIIRYAYVEGDPKYTRFFAQPVRLGKNGIEEIFPIDNLSHYEQEQLTDLLPILQEEIELGEDFIK